MQTKFVECFTKYSKH